MLMSEKAIKNWEVKLLRKMWHDAKFLGVEGGPIQASIDAVLSERGAVSERDRMMKMHRVLQKHGSY